MNAVMEPVNEEIAPELNYHILKYAIETYAKNTASLTSDEYRKVLAKAHQSFELESKVMGSDEVRHIVISSEQIDQAVNEIAARYQSREEFIDDLQQNGLSESNLKRALQRELLFDAVMQKVSSEIPEVSDVDIELFYQMHKDRFSVPEQRTARHILITINPDYSENTEQAALDRISGALQKLNGRTNRFEDFAKRYSECPTAMEGGKLGDVVKGQLYPELDAALFEMSEQTISPIIETEIGYHILYCEKIKPAKKIALSKVRDKIKETLTARISHKHQKSWIDSLS